MNILLLLAAALFVAETSAFTVVSHSTTTLSRAPPLQMVDPLLVDQSMDVSSSLLLAETEAWVQPLAFVLGPFLNLFSFAMVGTRTVHKPCVRLLAVVKKSITNVFCFNIVAALSCSPQLVSKNQSK